MGSNVSTQAVKQSQNIIKSTLNKQNTNADSNLKCDASATQTIIVGAGGDMKMGGNCHINIGQKSKVNLNCTMKASQQVQTQQGAAAATQLKALANQKITAANKELTLLQSNVAVAHSKSDQYLNEHVQNIVNSTIKNTLTSDANASQTINLNFKNLDCEGGELDISQDGILDSISKSVASQLVAGWQKAVGKDVVSAIDKQEGKLTNTGTNVNTIFIIFGIVACVFVVAFVWFLTSESKQARKLVTGSENAASKTVTGSLNAVSNITTLSRPTVVSNPVPQP